MNQQKKTEHSAGGIVFRKNSNNQTPDRNGIDNALSHSRLPNTEWLITQHSLHKGWGFPKGIVGDVIENEPMEEAALREVNEEGGIVARIIDPMPVSVHYTYSQEDFIIDKTVTYFLMEYISGTPDDHDWEVSEALFLSTEEIEKRLTFDSDREAFAAILAKFTDRQKS